MKKIFPLLLQFFCCLALSLGAFLLKPLPALHAVLLWGLVPMLGALSAFMLVKRGYNAYLSWIAPPLALTLGALIASMGYLPDGAAVLLDAFLSIVGAAVGDSLINRKKPRK